MFDILLKGGHLLDGTGQPPLRADLVIQGTRIAAIERTLDAEAHQILDVSGKMIAPGFIDAHVHADLCLLDDPYHEPAIRQGVTTYILGQDGVAMAPGSPATLEYMRRYTAGFSGLFAQERSWAHLGEYLDQFDRRCAVNVACLVPNGNLRLEVMGLENRPPRPDELRSMRALLREAMEQGAVGLSSGLDYIPSRFAETAELTALCEEMAPFEGSYVTHMRHYDPERVRESMNEVFTIGEKAGCAVHISHFNSRADLVLPHLDVAIRRGLDATYDLYCYLAGSTILGMVALPVWVQEGDTLSTLERLKNPDVRKQLRSWFAQPRLPLDEVRLSFIAAPEYRALEGQTLPEAANRVGSELGDFVCDLLVASSLAVGCIVPHRQRDESDIRSLTCHPAMMAGSDGIYTGGRPHPRGRGCFARYLGHYVRAGVWKLEQAVQHLAAHAARRFGLKDRGILRPGLVADVVVFDPETIADCSTYEDGLALAAGMEHVLVQGEFVLREATRTRALPGRALRRNP